MLDEQRRHPRKKSVDAERLAHPDDHEQHEALPSEPDATSSRNPPASGAATRPSSSAVQAGRRCSRDHARFDTRHRSVRVRSAALMFEPPRRLLEPSGEEREHHRERSPDEHRPPAPRRHRNDESRDIGGGGNAAEADRQDPAPDSVPRELRGKHLADVGHRDDRHRRQADASEQPGREQRRACPTRTRSAAKTPSTTSSSRRARACGPRDPRTSRPSSRR